jgi:hypothetical protein
VIDQRGLVQHDDRPIEDHELEPDGAVIGDQHIGHDQIWRGVGVVDDPHIRPRDMRPQPGAPVDATGTPRRVRARV